jgi:hypothetical protein
LIKRVRAVVSSKPLLDALSVVFQRGVIGLGAVTLALSGHVDISASVHGDGVRTVRRIDTGTVVASDPFLRAGRVVLNGAVLGTGSETDGFSRDVGIARRVSGQV